MNQLHGVLLLNKPRGMTSHDCVFKMRKLLKTKKIGHTGTLDPDVDGVLPLCIGEATKLVQFLTADEKRYHATVAIGTSTNTEDSSGEIVEQNIPNLLTQQQITDVLLEMHGQQQQMPPMFSAVKVNGKRLYEYARKGETVERPVRTITLHELNQTDELVQQPDGLWTFSVDILCSKGTYIRTVAVTIGEKLGYPAHMAQLTRTQSGSFTLDQCVTFEQVEQLIQEERSQEAIVDMKGALQRFPSYVPTQQQLKYVLTGGVFPKNEFPSIPEDGMLVVEKECGTPIGIYGNHPTKEDLVKPIRLFHFSEE
ncbi:MAG: tRNA pseudouridine(55) synthase TruB [Bacilli bacterium]